MSLVDTSPYTYAAIGCFFISACSSDLLVIRLSLMGAYALLSLAAWSDYSTDGSFSSSTMPFTDGSIDLSIILYTILFVWNLGSCLCLLDDIRPRRKLPPDDQALYHFFQRRCGLTRLEFDEIRSHGHYMEIGSNTEVPFTDMTLYLVLEGLVECETRERTDPGRVSTMFPKRSGQFFDLKFFNIFSLPVGFDSLHFKATTATRTRLFGWSVRALTTMRDSKSPSLRPFWEFMILSSLARDSVRHHLQAADASENPWPLPESHEWWDGLPSCDFEKPNGIPSDNSRPSVFQILPSKGTRNRSPSILLERQGQQNCIEIVAKAKEDCVDRMEGEEGSWQNVLFMSTFGCFKESSNSEDGLSSPSKSTSMMEEPTNQATPVRSNSTTLPYQTSAREYDGNHYTKVGNEERRTTTSSVRMRRHDALGVDGQSANSYDAPTRDHIPEGDQYLGVEHQSTNVQAKSSSGKADLGDEAKNEIEQEPMFESVWKQASTTLPQGLSEL